MDINLTCAAFKEGEPIPPKHCCVDVDISPALQWDMSDLSVPDTGSIALICDDPDAPGGTWVHWVIFNLPPETRNLPEMVMPREELENGARQGSNSWGTIGYRGPCPPSGTHRYFFKIYALDTKLDLPPGASKEELLEAMEGHIIGGGKIMGVFTRK